MPLVVRNADFLGPSVGELGNPLDVLQPLRRDYGPVR
jgi:hypothetical protein